MNYMPHYEVTDKIIAAFYKVYNTLGYGFLERVYENAMTIELRNMGCTVSKQKKIEVFMILLEWENILRTYWSMKVSLLN